MFLLVRVHSLLLQWTTFPPAAYSPTKPGSFCPFCVFGVADICTDSMLLALLAQENLILFSDDIFNEVPVFIVEASGTLHSDSTYLANCFPLLAML